jgi:hypothetical protein
MKQLLTLISRINMTQVKSRVIRHCVSLNAHGQINRISLAQATFILNIFSMTVFYKHQ